MTRTDIRSSTLSLLCGRAGCVDVRKVCQKDGVSWGITPPFSLSKYFLTYSSPSFYSLACLAHTSVAGVRPGRRATFDRAKVAKTRDALLATSQRADASLRRASQLAEPVLRYHASFVEGLGQGLPVDESIRPRWPGSRRYRECL